MRTKLRGTGLDRRGTTLEVIRGLAETDGAPVTVSGDAATGEEGLV
jgi:hypothetical protein